MFLFLCIPYFHFLKLLCISAPIVPSFANHFLFFSFSFPPSLFAFSREEKMKVVVVLLPLAFFLLSASAHGKTLKHGRRDLKDWGKITDRDLDRVEDEWLAEEEEEPEDMPVNFSSFLSSSRFSLCVFPSLMSLSLRFASLSRLVSSLPV
jgi:hypothetical protein